MNHDLTLHINVRHRERHDVAFSIAVLDGFIDRQRPRGIADMLGVEFQRGALVIGGAQRVHVPAQGSIVEHDCRPLARGKDVADAELVVQLLADGNIGGAGLGDIRRQVFKQFLQIFIVGRACHMRSVGVGRPFVQYSWINAVRADQANAVDDNALRAGGGGDGIGIRASRGLAVGEHDHDLRVGRSGVKQLRGLLESGGMVGISTGSEVVDRRVEIGDRCDQLRILRSGARKADDANAASGADLAIRCAVGRLFDDLDKFSRAQLQVCQRAARHAAGAVENQYNIRGVIDNIRRGCQSQRHFKSVAAGNAFDINGFVGVCYAHNCGLLPSRGDSWQHMRACRGGCGRHGRLAAELSGVP